MENTYGCLFRLTELPFAPAAREKVLIQRQCPGATCLVLYITTTPTSLQWCNISEQVDRPIMVIMFRIALHQVRILEYNF